MLRLTYEYVKDQMEKEGYQLISDNYKNAHEKLNVKCNNNHNITITWNNWKKGSRCSECWGNKKHTFKEVKNSFEKENYQLLSKEYINTNTNLNFICNKGHECNNITFKEWSNGKRCTKCNGRWHWYTLEEVKEIFQKEGYELKSKEYKNTSQKLNFICDKGHKHSISLNNWLSGHRCKQCQSEKNRCYDNYSDWELYNKLVRNLSFITYRKYKHIINPNNLQLKRNFYHLDHIFPVSEGYKNNIPVFIMSSISNLQILTQEENLRKGTKISINKNEFIEKYYSNMEKY